MCCRSGRPKPGEILYGVLPRPAVPVGRGCLPGGPPHLRLGPKLTCVWGREVVVGG